MVEIMAEKKECEVDEILPFVGEFSRFQIVVEILFCIAMMPQTLQILIMYFAALNSPWRCAANSTRCTFPRNQTFGSDSADYKARCDMERSDWEFVEPKDFSIVTQVCFDCDQALNCSTISILVIDSTSMPLNVVPLSSYVINSIVQILSMKIVLGLQGTIEGQNFFVNEGA